MTENESILRTLRAKLRMSQSELAKRAGIEQATISRIERGEMSLLSPHVERLARALGCSAVDLLGFSANVEPASLGARRIPVIDAVQAGHFAGVNELWCEGDVLEYVTTHLNPSPDAFAMRIRGTSMEPLFSQGDLVIIDPAVSPWPEDFVVAADEAGQATFKRFHRKGRNSDGVEYFELVPLNPAWETLRSDRQKLRIVGTMIEHRKFRRSAER